MAQPGLALSLQVDHRQQVFFLVLNTFSDQQHITTPTTALYSFLKQPVSTSTRAAMPLDHEVEYVPKLPLPARVGAQAQVKPHVDAAGYAKMYKQSLEEPEVFWNKVGGLLSHCSTWLVAESVPSFLSQMAQETLSWITPYKTVSHGSFEKGDMSWFPEGGQ